MVKQNQGRMNPYAYWNGMLLNKFVSELGLCNHLILMEFFSKEAMDDFAQKQCSSVIAGIYIKEKLVTGRNECSV